MSNSEPNYQHLYQQMKDEMRRWNNAWFEARAQGGKMWWDGARWGFAQGLKDQGWNGTDWGYGKSNHPSKEGEPIRSPYDITNHTSDIAKSVSILLDTYITAHLDVGLEVREDDQVMLDMVPLTFYVTRYNTGDQVLFQYVAGKQRVVRIKTHDGIFVDDNGMTKNPQGQLFDKDATR